MKPSLLILAAGMGSRYGGLKQFDGLGPNKETILDYSVYDAIKGGFGKVVFVVRKSFRKEMEELTRKKYGSLVDLDYVEQELDKIPEGYELDPARIKPWGTAHAMLMAKYAIKEPFAVINADDYYGRNSFRILGNFLSSCANSEGKYSMIGFYLNKTLSESGSVSRGICTTDENDFLTSVEEHLDIAERKGIITGTGMNGKNHPLEGNAYTSMNMWGFTPDIFRFTESIFKDFLKENGHEPKKEFYIPYVVNILINKNMANVKILATPDRWFGVTYKEDRPMVVAKFRELADKGIYPSPLFHD